MALSPSQTMTLRRKARRNALEVEDVLKVACIGAPPDAETLRALAAELDWSRGVGGAGNDVPLGLWADVACTFLEKGYEGLDTLSQDEPMVPFCLGLLERLKTPACFELLNRLAERVEKHETRMKVASTINLVCSFDGAPLLSPVTEESVRRWLHGLLVAARSPHEQAVVVCALRGVGDTESIDRIRRLPPFAEPWKHIEKTSARAIKKRLAIQSARLLHTD
jgi:hypothetical protein